MKKYNDFIKYVVENEASDLRIGQNLMICLRDKYQKLYNEIKCTDLDCFYDDKKVCHVLNWLEIRLYEEGE